MAIKKILNALKKAPNERKLCFLGLDGAGKTSLIKKQADFPINGVLPTQGFTIIDMEWDGVKFRTWDIGGAKSNRPYWFENFDNIDFIAFTVDSAAQERLEEAAEVLQDLLTEEMLQGCPLLILANKQDLSDALPIEEIEALLGLENIRNRPYTIQPCSALNGEGLADGLRWLAEILR